MNVYMTPETRSQVELLAKHLNASMSDVVRVAVNAMAFTEAKKHYTEEAQK